MAMDMGIAKRVMRGRPYPPGGAPVNAGGQNAQR